MRTLLAPSGRYRGGADPVAPYVYCREIRGDRCPFHIPPEVL